MSSCGVLNRLRSFCRLFRFRHKVSDTSNRSKHITEWFYKSVGSLLRVLHPELFDTNLEVFPI